MTNGLVHYITVEEYISIQWFNQSSTVSIWEQGLSQIQSKTPILTPKSQGRHQMVICCKFHKNQLKTQQQS